MQEAPPGSGSSSEVSLIKKKLQSSQELTCSIDFIPCQGFLSDPLTDFSSPKTKDAGHMKLAIPQHKRYDKVDGSAELSCAVFLCRCCQLFCLIIMNHSILCPLSFIPGFPEQSSETTHWYHALAMTES